MTGSNSVSHECNRENVKAAYTAICMDENIRCQKKKIFFYL